MSKLGSHFKDNVTNSLRQSKRAAGAGYGLIFKTKVRVGRSKNVNPEQTFESGEGVSHANMSSQWKNISDREKKQCNATSHECPWDLGGLAKEPCG